MATELGINLPWTTDWLGPFTNDVIKNARPFSRASNAAIEYNADGWPIRLNGHTAESILITPVSQSAGDWAQDGYRLVTSGTGTFQITGMTDAGGGLYNYDGVSSVKLFISSTDENDPLKVALYHPGSNDTDLICPRWKAWMNQQPSVKFNPLRFMNPQQTNFSDNDHPDDRTETSYTFNNAGFGTKGGAPAEWCVKAAWEMGECDAWIHAYHKYEFNESTIRTQAQRVAAARQLGQHIFIETSNEAWNGSFSHNQWYKDQGQIYINDPDVTVVDTEWQRAMLYHAKQSALVGKIYKEELGSDVTVLLGGQITGSWTTGRVLQDMSSLEISYLDEFTTGGYFGGNTNYDGDTTAAEMLQTLANSTALQANVSTYQSDVFPDWLDLAAQYGKTTSIYEWNQHFSHDDTAALYDVIESPEVQQMLRDQFSGYVEKGVTRACFFQAINVWGSESAWGISPNFTDISVPEATIRDLLANPPTSSTDPNLSSTLSISVDEGDTFAGSNPVVVGTAPLSWSIVAGADAVDFTIDTSTGRLSFVSTPVYATKSSYSVTRRVTNGNSDTADQVVTITVNDPNVDIPPSFNTSSVSEDVVEGQLQALGAPAVSGTSPITFALSGTDSTDFTIDSNTGELTFVNAPVYLIKNQYSLNRIANGPGGQDTQTVVINITQLVNLSPSQHFYDFSALSVGALPSGIVANRVAGAIVDDSGVNVLEISGAGTARHGSITLNELGVSTDVETVVKFFDSSGQTYNNGIGALARLAISASNDLGTNAYRAATGVFFTTQNRLGAGSGTLDSNEPTTAGFSVWRYARIRAEGQTIKAWFWEEGETAKTLSDTPDFEVTDTTYEGDGLTGVYADITTDATGTAKLAFVGVGLNGAEAPLAPVPPVFSSDPFITNITSTGGRFSAVIDQTGDIFFVIVARDDTAPTPAEIVAGTASGGGTAIYAGSQLNATSITDSFSNVLTANTSYDVYSIARNSTGDLQTSSTLTQFTSNVGNIPVMPDDQVLIIGENATVVGNVSTAISGDSPITYSKAGPDEALFNIDSTTGQLTLITPSDYEVKAAYFVTVVATNIAGTDSQSVTVNISNTLEQTITPPVNQSVQYPFDETGILETNADFQAWLATASTTGTGLTNNSSSLSYPASGVITVIFTADDASPVSATYTATRQTNPPVLPDDQIVVVAEGNTVVGNSSVAISGNDVVYSISGGADSPSFEIDPVTAQLTFITAPDYEIKTTYSVQITGSNSDGDDTQNITVLVNNILEQTITPPVNATGEYEFGSGGILQNDTDFQAWLATASSTGIGLSNNASSLSYPATGAIVITFTADDASARTATYTVTEAAEVPLTPPGAANTLDSPAYRNARQVMSATISPIDDESASVNVVNAETLLFDNSVATTITNLTGGRPGQRVRIASTNSLTTVAHNAGSFTDGVIRNATGADITLNVNGAIDLERDLSNDFWRVVNVGY